MTLTEWFLAGLAAWCAVTTFLCVRAYLGARRREGELRRYRDSVQRITAYGYRELDRHARVHKQTQQRSSDA